MADTLENADAGIALPLSEGSDTEAEAIEVEDPNEAITVDDLPMVSLEVAEEHEAEDMPDTADKVDTPPLSAEN